MRTLGTPSASTVASAIAVGSDGSALTASSNQAENSPTGSLILPDFNEVEFSIDLNCDFDPGNPLRGATAPADQQPRYSGRTAGRLSGRARRLAAVAAAFLLALANGGCAYRLSSLLGDKGEETGSLKPAKTD